MKVSLSIVAWANGICVSDVISLNIKTAAVPMPIYEKFQILADISALAIINALTSFVYLCILQIFPSICR